MVESKVLFYEPNPQTNADVLRSITGTVEDQGEWMVIHRRDGDWKIKASKVIAVKPVHGAEVRG